jgi:nucleoside-diphosphate-sugar epimerase
MKVLVMGGTRFNGLALVHELHKHGHEVTILNRGVTEAAIPPSVKRLTADRNDADSLRAALGDEEFDCVQDISGYNLPQVQTLVEILKGRVGHYIFASSTVSYAATRMLPIRETSATDATPRQSEYARNKLICEDYLFRLYRQERFPATSVPFSMVFGPNNIIPDREQRMFQRMLQGRPILVPGDGRTVGMIGHVDDEARALRMMMGQPITFGKRYNLTGLDCYTDDGYVDTFAEVVGVEPQRVYVPAEVMDELWDGEAQTVGRASILIQKVAPHIHRWNSSVFFSVDRLRRDVAWEPEYGFRAAVEQTYEWYRREGLDQTREFDFSFEDGLLERLRAG